MTVLTPSNAFPGVVIPQHLSAGIIDYPTPLLAFPNKINPATNSSGTLVDAPSGSLIVIFCLNQTTGDFASAITDSAGNIYTLAIQNTGNIYGCSIFHCDKTVYDLLAGSTFSFTGTQPCSLLAVSVQGANGGLDIAVVTSSGGATSASLASGTLASSLEIIFAVLNPDTVIGTFTEGIPFSTLTPGQQSAAQGGDIAYAIVNSTSSVTYDPSWVNNVGFGAAIVSFKASIPQLNTNFVWDYQYPGAVQPFQKRYILSSNNAFPGIAIPQHLSGQSVVQNYLYPGALQPLGLANNNFQYLTNTVGKWPVGAVPVGRGRPPSGVLHTLSLVFNATAGALGPLGYNLVHKYLKHTAIATVPTVQKAITKAVGLFTSIVTSPVKKQVNKSFSSTITTLVAYAETKLKYLTLTFNVAATFASNLYQVRKTFITNATAVVTDTKLTSKNVGLAGAIATSLIIKQVNKTLTETVVVVANTLAQKVFIRTYTATTIVTTSFLYQVAKTIQATATALASDIKQVGKKILSNATMLLLTPLYQVGKTLISQVTATTLNNKSVEKILTSYATSTSLIQKAVGKIYSFGATCKATMQRMFGYILTATATAGSLITKQVQKTLTGTITTGVKFSTLKTKLVTVNATVIATALYSKSILKILSFTTACKSLYQRTLAKTYTGAVIASSTLQKSINKSFKAAITALITIQKTIGKLYLSHITATASRSGAFLKQFIHSCMITAQKAPILVSKTLSTGVTIQSTIQNMVSKTFSMVIQTYVMFIAFFGNHYQVTIDFTVKTAASVITQFYIGIKVIKGHLTKITSNVNAAYGTTVETVKSVFNKIKGINGQ